MEISIALFVGVLLIFDFVLSKSNEITDRKILNFIAGILLIIFGIVLIGLEK